MMHEAQHPNASGGREKLLPFCFAQDSPVQVRRGIAVSGQSAGTDVSVCVCDCSMLNAAWDVLSALCRCNDVPAPILSCVTS